MTTCSGSSGLAQWNASFSRLLRRMDRLGNCERDHDIARTTELVNPEMSDMIFYMELESDTAILERTAVKCLKTKDELASIRHERAVLTCDFYDKSPRELADDQILELEEVLENVKRREEEVALKVEEWSNNTIELYKRMQ